MAGNGILIKIILIPTLHFMISILFVGAGLLLFFQERLIRKNYSGPGNFLIAVALGILYNTAQFSLVLLVYRKFPVDSQTWLSIGKYAMDLAFLLFVLLFFKKKYFDLLKQLTRAFSIPGNAALLLLALLLGFVAVINFPHVHDSGQLIATNNMLLKGTNFLAAKRYGLGFSALCYFPTAIFKSIPMGTLAAGFKLFLLLLTGLAVIFVIEKFPTIDSTVSKFLYLIIFISSYFGLYGIMELGKDSAWAVLFSLIFIFSLFDWNSKKGYFEPCLYFVCAMALGMIVIPYLCIFCAVFIIIRLLPGKISDHKVIFPAVVILMLGICAKLMPVKMAIYTPPYLPPTKGNYIYHSPTNGKTSFHNYFFAFEKKGYKNSSPLIIAGLLGILLLPLAKKRFANAAIKSTALFLPAAALGCLFLTFLARDFLPASRHDKIPFTPFSTFDAQNLVKDIPQWYVQIISGIFFILLLNALVIKMTVPRKARQTIYLGVSVIAAAVILSANFSQLLSLKKPAYFYSYGGNKNKYYALLLENIHRNRGLKRIYLMKKISSVNPRDFFWGIKHYVHPEEVEINFKIETAKIPCLADKMPFMLVSGKDSLARLSAAIAKYGTFYIYELEYFKDVEEGIYVISGKEGNFAATSFSQSSGHQIGNEAFLVFFQVHRAGDFAHPPRSQKATCHSCQIRLRRFL